MGDTREETRTLHQVHCPACRRRLMDVERGAIANGKCINHKCGRCNSLIGLLGDDTAGGAGIVIRVAA